MSDLPDILRPLFTIDCVGEEGPCTDYERACGEWRSVDKMMTLLITTPAGKWIGYCSRSEMAILFEAIERRGGFKIAFNPKPTNQTDIPPCKT